MARVTLDAVRKVYGGTVEAVRGVSLDVDDGSFCVLVGPSGCGKSTLLRMIAGFVEPSKGSIGIDGAGAFRFFKDTLVPLSLTTMAALFVIQFIYGWNQYLWPLLITTTDSMQTIVIGIKKMIVTQDALTEWQLAMATAVLAMLPPVFVVVLMQRLFVKGLVETEK